MLIYCNDATHCYLRVHRTVYFFSLLVRVSSKDRSVSAYWIDLNSQLYGWGLSSLDVSVTKDVCYAKVIDSTPLNTVIFLLYFLQLLRSKQFVGHWSELLISRWLIPTLTWWNSIRQRIFYSWIFYRRMNGKHCSVRIRCVHCKIALPCTKSRIVELFHLNFVEAWSKCRKIVPHISKAYFFLYHFRADTVNIKCVLYAISMKHVSAACDILQLFVLIRAQSVGSGMLFHSFSSRFLFRLMTLTFCK